MCDSSSSSQQDHVRQDIGQIIEATHFCIFTSFRLAVPDDLADIPAKLSAKLCTQNQPLPFSYHQERLVRSAEAFGWLYVADCLGGPRGLQRLADAVGAEVSCTAASATAASIFKVRLTVSRDAVIGVDCSQLAMSISSPADTVMHVPQELVVLSHVPASCRVVLDTEPTQPSLVTTHKTNARRSYDNARERAKISTATADRAEVLLFNPQSEIMEASVSTPYFYRTGRWVTPPLSSGGNSGVTRRVALESGLCVEAIVLVDSLRDGETPRLLSLISIYELHGVSKYDYEADDYEADDYEADDSTSPE